MEVEYTATDPKAGKANGVDQALSAHDDTDITEASCLPDLNEHMPSVKAGAQRPLRGDN